MSSVYTIQHYVFISKMATNIRRPQSINQWINIDNIPNRHRTRITRHTASTSTRWHFAFGNVCCHSNKTSAPIANSPNVAQLEGTRYYFVKLHPGSCSSVRMRRETVRQAGALTAVTTIIIHFASATPHAKCNNHPHLTIEYLAIYQSINALTIPQGNPPFNEFFRQL